jgi:CheY-like chemotaxis protein
MALNGRQALESLAYDIPQLIIMNMPVMNGPETVRAIRKNEVFNKIPIVGYSAAATFLAKKEVLDAGCNHYFTKPYRFSSLLLIINGYDQKETLQMTV